MAANIEIKARIDDFDLLQTRAVALSHTAGKWLQQEDIFFHTARGRLKLRIFNREHGELIYYERADSHGPRQSSYEIAPCADPLALKATLAAALGVRGVVKKRRLLFLVGQTRIHLDQVEGLGHFMELEYVLQPGESAGAGLAAVHALMAQLGVKEENLLDKAYIDLLTPL